MWNAIRNFLIHNFRLKSRFLDKGLNLRHLLSSRSYYPSELGKVFDDADSKFCGFNFIRIMIFWRTAKILGNSGKIFFAFRLIQYQLRLSSLLIPIFMITASSKLKPNLPRNFNFSILNSLWFSGVSKVADFEYFSFKSFRITRPSVFIE